MDVINSFFGAVTGFWIVFAFKEKIIISWYYFFPLFILVVLMHNFNKFANPPKDSSNRYTYFFYSLASSFIVSTVLQIIETPKIHLIDFICLPQTWLLTVIILLWGINLNPPNINIFRRGE